MLLWCFEVPVPKWLLYYRYTRGRAGTGRLIGLLRFALRPNPSTGRVELPDLGDAGVVDEIIRSIYENLACAWPRVDLLALGGSLCGDSIPYLCTNIDFNSMAQNAIPDS